MPGMDGTGPAGMGPMTGGGYGRCRGARGNGRGRRGQGIAGGYGYSGTTEDGSFNSAQQNTNEKQPANGETPAGRLPEDDTQNKALADQLTAANAENKTLAGKLTAADAENKTLADKLAAVDAKNKALADKIDVLSKSIDDLKAPKKPATSKRKNPPVKAEKKA